MPVTVYPKKENSGDSYEHLSFSMDDLPPDPDASLSESERAANDRKLVRKQDWVLLPWLCFLYLICFLDRANIGNAKIANMTEELNMNTTQFNGTLTIFFIAYSFFEALSNLLLKRFRPSLFLPMTMVLWGGCMLGMGFVKDWNGLMVARFFLGMTEAGLYPGVTYYLSCWYKRSELAARTAIFFSAAALSGSFGGLLAAAIQTMDGLGGLSGWRWIFILESLLTIVVGIISFWVVQDFPQEAKFLSEEDRARTLHRLRLDKQRSASSEDFKLAYIWAALKDWKTYLGMLVFMGPLMPIYSFSLFLPTIIKNMGFTADQNIVVNQLLSVPPYAAATIVTITVGFASDKQNRRGIYNILIAPIGIVGFSMVMASRNPSIQYAGTFLGAMGIYPAIPVSVTWIANNVEGVYKRGVVLGLIIGWGNLNGIVASNIWFNPADNFTEGHATVIAYIGICYWGGSILMHLLLRRENRLRRSGKRDEWVEGKTVEELDIMGDERPDFIYTL